MQMQGQAQGPAQAPYGSILLNELHTYFPALLYEPGRFVSTTSVMNYIQQQMRARFDLYSNLQSQYRAQHPRAAAPPIPHRVRPYMARPVVPPSPVPSGPNVTTAAPPLEMRVTTQFDPAQLPALLSQAMSLDPVTQLLLSVAGTPPLNFYDPVPVAPTAAQLEANTTVAVAAAALETPCAICQDTISAGDTSRQLHNCRHVFHRSCIDTWFQRNCLCPVCRSDIRSSVPTQLPQQPQQP